VRGGSGSVGWHGLESFWLVFFRLRRMRATRPSQEHAPPGVKPGSGYDCAFRVEIEQILRSGKQNADSDAISGKSLDLK
jgi:hypothetical protein